MTSTAGLELDLSWKMVSKGNRSATRRTRKSVAKNSTGVPLSDGNSRPAEDVIVSDSEKLGVAVLGQRFSDKIEHVPIKKRRFVVQTTPPPPSPPQIKKRRFVVQTTSPPPSPPQTPSLPVEVPDQQKDIQSASGQSGFSNSTLKQQTMEMGILTKSTTGVIDGKFSEVSSEKVGCVEDFSGIEMLAAAACNDGVDDYADNNEKNPSVEESKQARDKSSSFPLMPLEETTALLETDSCPQKDSGYEIKVEDSSLLPPNNSGNEAKMEDSSLLPPKDSENEVKMEDLSLVPPKDSGHEVKMEESYLLPAKDSGHEVKMEDSSLLAPQDSGHEVKIEDSSVLAPQDSGNDNKSEDSSILDNSVAVLHKSPSDKKTGEMSICLPDDRSLWDLNLSMDAWERPCDNAYDDSKTNAVDNIHVDKDAILQNKDLQGKKTDSVDKGDKCSPSNYGALPVGTDGLNEKEDELGGCSSLSGNNSEHLSLTANNAADSAKCVDDDVNVSTRLVGVDQCSSPCPKADNITSVMVLKKNTETSASQGNVELGKTDCVSRNEVGIITGIKSVEVEESDVVSPCVPVLEMAIKDVECQTVNEDGKTYGGDSGLHDDKISGEDMEICQPLRNVMPEAESADGAEEVGTCHASLKFEGILASGLSVVVADVKGQSAGASSSFDPEIDTSALLEPEKTSRLSESHPATSTVHGFTVANEACGNGPPSSLDKVDATDSCNQNHESAANAALSEFTVAPEAGGSDGNAHCNQNHESAASKDKAFIGGKESSFDLQAGYDSQFEDGELRESDVPCWDEIEQVDYDTEGEEERLCGLEAENNEEKLKSERGSSSGSDDIIEKTKNRDTQDSLGENVVTLNLTSVAVMEASESKMDTIDFVDGSGIKAYHCALDGSKPSKRELLSGIEASPSSDALQTSRSGNCDDLNPQAEKDLGPENFTGRDRSTSHIRGRSPGGGRFISHSAGQSSPLYHGGNPSLRSRPRSAIEGRGYAISADQALSEPGDAARPENRISRRFMGSHSNGMYRPLMRRRSPGERDDSFGMHMRMATVRDTSPDRSRFGRYPQGVSKGIRDEYLRHIPDDTPEYFSRLPSSDAVQRSRSGNFDDSYAQSEREGGSDKFIGRDRPATTRMHGRNPGGGHFFNPSGGVRDEYIRHVADDGPEYFSRLPSSDALRRSRSDNFDDSYPQTEREGGSDKFIGRGRPMSRMRGRSPGGGHFFNPSAGYWDSKRQHSPNHHGAYHSACLRAKSAIEGRGYVVSTDQTLPEAAGVTARPDNRINRHFMSSTSNGGYRPLNMRRRSPVERDDSYGMHMRMTTVRDGSPGRSRFRRYPPGVGRGVRDDYLRHDPDETAEYITRLPHRLGRRERSISPEGHYVEPYKKTQSRSRSRSPMGFLVQRDRNEGSRRHHRLTDFRSDARTDRVKFFPKRFPPDYGEGFISTPQDRISPQRNSRVFEDRNSGLDHLRGRKSPVRMLREAKF